ncbi:MAG TPA: ABC transporter permease [Blastocatellia bacterium]|nr:ABC transporter permease [Blastocatellia bacterium]HMV87791.1 ABC transporter permease [Blastocatellia bacterium]HMX26848.1 ABC transporter permease [Blastocatellia bacterium]HMZ20741.1 ABC transporter permease [Blastocatellia bacterium]HNG33543.1 ABC transporter permease [Blastocatellia bacterium]
MAYELFIALRYLRAKRKQTAVSVITAVAITGITIGVASLIVAQALIGGFRRNVQEKILQGTDHLNLLKEDNSGIENYRELIGRIRQLPGIISVSATIYAPVLLSVGGQLEQAVLKGVNLTAGPAAEFSPLSIEGSSDLRPTQAEQSESAVERIVIGRQLARTLGVKINDQVTAVSVATKLTPAGLQPRPRYTPFLIVGIFDSGWYQYDAKWAYISLTASQQLTGSGDTAGVIRLKVADIYQVNELGKQISAIGGEGFTTTNWQELNRPLFAALELQHRVVLVFFTLLILIAALNIITTLTMMVIEKHRDIAILRAQGAIPSAIRRIFLFQGLIIGMIGAGIGLSLGFVTCWIANHYKMISIPAEIYSVSHIDLDVQALDCVWITALAISISLLATLYPARAASQLPLSETLHHE